MSSNDTETTSDSLDMGYLLYVAYKYAFSEKSEEEIERMVRYQLKIRNSRLWRVLNDE